MTDHETHAAAGRRAPRATSWRRSAATGVVRISQLIDELGVAPVTLRRDLAQMEQEGLLVRVHGGAVPAGDTGPASGTPAGGAVRGRRVDRGARPLAQLLLAGGRPRRGGGGEAARHGSRAARSVVRAAGRAPGAGAAGPHRQRAGPHRRAQHRHAPRAGRHPVARRMRRPERPGRARRRAPARTAHPSSRSPPTMPSAPCSPRATSPRSATARWA